MEHLHAFCLLCLSFDQSFHYVLIVLPSHEFPASVSPDRVICPSSCADYKGQLLLTARQILLFVALIF